MTSSRVTTSVYNSRIHYSRQHIWVVHMFLYSFVLAPKKEWRSSKNHSRGDRQSPDLKPDRKQSSGCICWTEALLEPAGSPALVRNYKIKNRDRKCRMKRLFTKTSVVQSGGCGGQAAKLWSTIPSTEAKKIQSAIQLPAEKPWQQSAAAASTIKIQRRPADRLRWASPSAPK